MRRRRFLVGLGSASAVGQTAIGASSARPSEGGPKGRRDGGQGRPVENLDTGETFSSIGPAIEAADAGHTLTAALGATFDEQVTIDTAGLTLQATGDSRLTVDGLDGLLAVEESGRSRTTIDENVEVLSLETSGTARPTVVGDVDVLVLECTGNSRPVIESDLEKLLLDSRGNSRPVIEGDVGTLVSETRGNARPTFNGAVGESADGPGPASQPTIAGGVVVDANDVAIEGFDVEVAPDGIGIDVRAPDPATVRLSNNRIANAAGATNNDGDPPERGVGIRVPAQPGAEHATIGGEHGSNVVVDNDVGLLVIGPDGGGIADVDTTSILENNTFVRNRVGLLPDPGTPKDAPDPSVSAEPPVEVLASERSAGETITADLPDVALDEAGTMRMLSVSVRRASSGPIELTYDPDASVRDDLVGGYAPIDDGAFEIDTTLAESELEAVRFTFAVDRAALEDPEAFVLHRETDAGLEPLRTEFVAETPESYQYAALSPGFSLFQTTEFAVGGVGGPGREIDGTLVLPEREDPNDEFVDEVFARVESSGDADDLRLTSTDPAVSIDDEVEIDLSSSSEDDLPKTFVGLFEIENTGTEPATVRTSTGLSRATFSNVPLDLDLEDLLDGPVLGTRALHQLVGAIAEFAAITSNPIELDPGEATSIALSFSETEPDDQLWVTLGVPTLTDEQSGDPFSAPEATDNIGAGIADACENLVDGLVMHHSAYGYDGSDGWWFTSIGAGEDWIPEDADGDTRYLRVPAYVSVNWHGSARGGGSERIAVRLEPTGGPDGSLVGIFDKHGIVGDEGDLLTPPIATFYSPEDFTDGSVSDEFDLVFESTNDCDPDFATDLVTMDRVYDHVGNLEITVLFHGSDNRWAELTGRDDVSAAAPYYTLGDTTSDVTNELLEETFQKFAEGMINAALPGPVLTYRAARALVTGSRAGLGELASVAIWQGADGLDQDLPLTPHGLLSRRLATGMTGFTDGGPTELSEPLQELGLDLGFFGPSVYVSDDVEPECIDPDVRTRSVAGQVTGGPVILMGLDSEWGAGDPHDHGSPEDHASMVQHGILDNVTNGGDGILVLGGADGEVEAYWREDVGENVDEEVTFKPTAGEIADADFDGYAVIGIATDDTYSLSGRGVTDEENAAIIERDEDIAAFVNGGGGLLGKSQDTLSDPWGYIDPFGDFEPNTAANFVDVEVEDTGLDLGLDQETMSGWCCWHETFASFPDFFDVLVTNTHTGDPGFGEAAAIGGDAVVIRTAVDLEVTGPANVEVGDAVDYEFSLENATDTAGEDVRVELEISRDDGIDADDVEVRDAPDLVPNGEVLTTTLTEEPIPFPPELDLAAVRTLSFHDTGGYHVTVDVVNDATDDRIVSLPYGIRCVGDTPGVCDE